MHPDYHLFAADVQQAVEKFIPKKKFRIDETGITIKGGNYTPEQLYCFGNSQRDLAKYRDLPYRRFVYERYCRDYDEEYNLVYLYVGFERKEKLCFSVWPRQNTLHDARHFVKDRANQHNIDISDIDFTRDNWYCRPHKNYFILKD